MPLPGFSIVQRFGRRVLQLTSTDEGNVEDPENPTPGGGDENEGLDII